MLILAVPVGVLIGLSLGALGAGGSILTVPALVYLLGQSPHQATATSLVIVGVSSVVGAVAHGRLGRVRLWPGVVFGVLGAAGSVLGSKASAAVAPDVLLLGFAGLMLLAAVAMLRRARREPAATGPTDRAAADGSGGGSGGVAVAVRNQADRAAAGLAGRVTMGRAAKLFAAATVVGLLTGFFGVGGGFVVVPALVLALGYDTASAVGTSLVVIAINSAVALAVRLDTHSTVLDWPLLALFLGAAIVGVVFGNRVASRVAPHRLTVSFAVMLIVLAVYTGAQSLIHLS